MKLLSPLVQLSLVLAGSIALASAAPAESDGPFARANQEYADGKFKEAIGDYEAAVRAGDWTAALFYDLGNAYFRTRDFGRAILNYERALALESNHPEAAANLRIARDEARALELGPAWPDRALRFANLSQFTAGAAALFWIGAFLLALGIFSRRRRGRLVALSISMFIAALLLLLLIVAVENGPKGRSLAIVTGGETQARLATADTASSVLVLPAGSEVLAEQQRGEWVYASLPNNLRGWIPARSIEFVRL
jgi:tetratricopeptide (TPR) repeat protein